jgi:hypothetical protein
MAGGDVLAHLGVTEIMSGTQIQRQLNAQDITAALGYMPISLAGADLSAELVTPTAGLPQTLASVAATANGAVPASGGDASATTVTATGGTAARTLAARAAAMRVAAVAGRAAAVDGCISLPRL